MNDNLDWSAPRGDVPALDRAQLLHDIEMHALRDSQSSYGEDDGPPPLGRQIEHWRDQRLAQLAEARAREERHGRERIRTAEILEAEAAERRDVADRAFASATARRDHLAAVVRGERPGDDGGRWSDRDRMSEWRWLARLVDGCLYGGAALAELGLNYLAFQLMGATPVETAVLAAGVVLVTVLLPAQLGVLVATARRTRRFAGWSRVMTIGSALIWVGVLVFVAVVRTAYVLLPPAFGRPLVETAGVGATVLTVGWLLVGLAVGLVVLVRSAMRHNPYAAAWHRARGQVRRRGQARTAARQASQKASERTARERDDLAALPRVYVPLAQETRALASELQQRYQHEVARRRASVEQCVSVETERPALGASEEGVT